MTRSTWLRLGRIVAGLLVIVGTIVTVGAAPIARGIVSITPLAVLAAILLTGLATVAAAWRWTVVSARLGLRLAWGDAIVAYYRSQFLNSVLPGGVVGDVHRAYRQGRRTDDVPTAARAVAVERIAGQIVQLPLALIVLAVTGALTQVRGVLIVGVGLLAALALALGVAVAIPRGRAALKRELRLLRPVFGSVRTVVQIVATSTLVVAAHTATFIIACLVVGSDAEPAELLALATIALAAAAIPAGIGGWGPREAVSASVFAVAGLSAAAGLAASAAFGVLTLISVLPGAVVMIATRTTPREPIRPTTEEEPA